MGAAASQGAKDSRAQDVVGGGSEGVGEGVVGAGAGVGWDLELVFRSREDIEARMDVGWRSADFD